MDHLQEDGMDIENADQKDTEDASIEDIDSDSSESEEEKEQFLLERRVVEIRKELSRSPYVYDLHVERIRSLKKLGELDQIRHAREAMHAIYPLTEELWLDWLKDEIALATNEDDRNKIVCLFQKATKDYLSIEIWFEYIQFSLVGMGSSDEEGLKKIRNVMEEAIRHGGLHVSKGALLWDSYRDFEMAVFQSGAKSDDEAENSTRLKNVTQLFIRQLAVPLLDMERTWSEYTEWIVSLNQEVEDVVKNSYEKAKLQLEKLAPLEETLSIATSNEDKVLVYKTYLEVEKKDFKDPARIQALYERIVAELPLHDSLWTDYYTYIDRDLKAGDAAFDVFVRATRNCPWRGSIWADYIYAAERYKKENRFISQLVEKAFAAGLGSAADYKMVWLAFIEFLVRNCKWKDEENIAQVREAFTRATDHIIQSFGAEGDPECSLLQYWAYIESRKLKNVTKAREIWGQIISLGHSKSAQWWLAYIQFERSNGEDSSLVRRLFSKSLQAVPSSDWPESIAQQWLQFEREEGNLETMENAKLKCEAKLEKVREEREKQTDDQATLKAQKRNKGDGDQDVKLPAAKKSKLMSPDSDVQKNKKKQAIESVNETNMAKPIAIRHAPDDLSLQARTVFISNLDFKVTEDDLRAVMSTSGTITDIRLVGDFKRRSKGYCYVEFSSENEAKEALKRDREPLNGRPMFISPSEKDHALKQPAFKYSNSIEKKKLFIKGLPPAASKEDLTNLFSKFGNVKDVRLVTFKSGAPKGLAYVEFEDEISANLAVKNTDGTQFLDRTLSVAISKPPPRADKYVPDRTEKEQPFSATALKAKKLQISLTPSVVMRKTNPPSNVASQASKSNADFRAMLLNKK